MRHRGRIGQMALVRCFIDPGALVAYGLKKGDVSTSAPVTPGFLGHLQAFNLRRVGLE